MPHTGPFTFLYEWKTLKITFDRVVTYHETCEATISGNDPLQSITANDFDTFIVTGREVLENKLGDIEQTK